MSSMEQVRTYYSKRAPEYDATAEYQRPGLATVIAPIKARYQLALAGHDVLEIACGPGFWTETVALTARSVLATDVDPGLVSRVKVRVASMPHVRCQVADAYLLENVSGRFTAAIAQFWWSHMPTSKTQQFLSALHAKLIPGALVMLLDSLPYNHGGSRRLDDAGDVLEERYLLNGARFEVIKNFPTESELVETFTGHVDEFSYKQFAVERYWTVSYRTR